MRKATILVATLGLIVGTSLLTLTGLAGAGGGPPVVQITISKVVVGTNPGVAFAITLTCDSEGIVDDDDFQIPNNGEMSEVVNLAHGQSTVVDVTLPEQEPETATCRVTEDITDTALPAGVTCTPSVTPEEVVVYDGDEHDGEFIVTNTCSGGETAPVVTFTGDELLEEFDARAAGTSPHLVDSDSAPHAAPRPVDRFRTTAVGTVVTAGLFGLRDALEGRPEREEIAIVSEAPERAADTKGPRVIVDPDDPTRVTVVLD
jgi:hypothetical protein